MNRKKKFEKAKKLFEKEKYEEAKKILEEILKKSNEELKKDVYYILAEIMDKAEQNYIEAIEYYRKILTYNLTEKERIDIHYKIGELYILKIDKENLFYPDDEERAKYLYNKAKENFRKSCNQNYKQYYIDSSIYLGECYDMLDEHKKVIKTLKDLNNFCQLNKFDQRIVYFQLGSSYFSIGNYQKAIKYLEKVNRQNIDRYTINSIILLGKAYSIEKEEIKAFKILIELLIYKQQKPEIITTNDLETVGFILKEIVKKIIIDDKKLQNRINEIIEQVVRDSFNKKEMIDNFVEICLEIDYEKHCIRKKELIKSCEKALSFLDNRDERYNKLKKKIEKLE